MNEKAVELVSFINSRPEFTDVIGSRLFPLVALKDTLMPFAIYTISSYPLSKDGDEYRIGIQAFFSTNEFTEMLNFIDVCKGIFSEKYDVGSVETDYSPEYESLFTTILLT
jgi:hypothetical protein